MPAPSNAMPPVIIPPDLLEQAARAEAFLFAAMMRDEHLEGTYTAHDLLAIVDEAHAVCPRFGVCRTFDRLRMLQMLLTRSGVLDAISFSSIALSPRQALCAFGWSDVQAARILENLPHVHSPFEDWAREQLAGLDN
jgi:hypothetical protein